VSSILINHLNNRPDIGGKDTVFLNTDKRYVAEIYRDGEDAHWKTNPYDMKIYQQAVASGETFRLTFAPSGSAAIRFRVVEAEIDKFSSTNIADQFGRTHSLPTLMIMELP